MSCNSSSQDIIDDESLRPLKLSTKSSVYDADIDEEIKPTGEKIEKYDTETRSNDVKDIAKNASPLRGFKRQSHKILRPMVSNDYPSSEDEDLQVEKLMSDGYLVMDKGVSSVKQDNVKPFNEPLFKPEKSDPQENAPKKLEFISKKQDIKKEEKVLDTKAESSFLLEVFFNISSLIVIFQKLLSIAYDDTSPWEVIKNDHKLKIYKIKVN